MATDVASEERKAFLAAEEAARRKVKFDNYRFYHEALNHSDSTTKALIDEGLVANTARPPGFSCAACSNAGPSGSHFCQNTKTSPSVPLLPFYHVGMDLWGPVDIGHRNPLNVRRRLPVHGQGSPSAAEEEERG